MDDKIICDCGSSVTKYCLSRHKRSKKHLNRLKQIEAPIETTNDVKEEEKEEENEIEETQEEDEGDEEIVEVEPQPKSNKKGGQSKEYMDAIRQKAIMTIKQKKQAKIDQETLISNSIFVL